MTPSHSIATQSEPSSSTWWMSGADALTFWGEHWPLKRVRTGCGSQLCILACFTLGRSHLYEIQLYHLWNRANIYKQAKGPHTISFTDRNALLPLLLAYFHLTVKTPKQPYSLHLFSSMYNEVMPREIHMIQSTLHLTHLAHSAL
jgi:hypothetical protein